MARVNWLLELARPKPAAIPWGRAVRVAAVMTLPVAIGLLAGHAEVGLEIGIGTLPSVTSDRSGTYRSRVLRMTTAAVAAGVGSLLGGVASGHGAALGILLPTVVAGLAILVASIGSTSSAASLQLLVFVALADTGMRTTSIWVQPALVLLGGGWALGVTALTWLSHPRNVEREAVADVVDSIAALIVAPAAAATGAGSVAAARRGLTTTLTGAYDAVNSLRLREPGRDRGTRYLLEVLHACTPLVEAAVSLTRERRPLPGAEKVAAAVADLAVAVRQDRAPADLPDVADNSAARRALRRALGDVRAAVMDAPRSPGLPTAMSDRERWQQLLDHARIGPGTLQIAVRVMLCIAVAEVVGEVAGLARSYWVVLTVAVVMKPDFGSVFARAVQRGAGTVVGAVLGVAVLSLVPRGPLLLPFIAIFAALLPIAQVRNYGMFTTFLTPLVIISLDYGTGDGVTLLRDRVLDTVTGCAITLLLGFAIWPDTWRPRLGDRVARTVEAVADYCHLVLGGPTTGRPAGRRRAYRTLSDQRTALQQALAEPTRAGRDAAELFPLVIGLEQVTDALTAVSIDIVRRRPQISPDDAVAVETSLREVAAAMRESRRPRRRPLPTDGELADVGREVGLMVGAVNGPSRRTRRRLLGSDR